MNSHHFDIDYREGLIEENIREYGYNYDALSFVTPESARNLQTERDELLAWLSGRAELGCRGTKVDCRSLSPGCRECVAGSWSCLFINGRCNCSCFYCPSIQDQTGVPQTNGIPFTSAADYGEYLALLGFTGASLSGGEPLLTLERTIEYLTAIRKRCGDAIHIWLYTNGTLLSADICRSLRDAGLDEIRFDIGAIRHNLKKVRLAVGIIPTVTVEIPAVPEELQLMKGKIVEMAEAGVNYLNLHQLRLTPHNFRHLSRRGYTFIHGEKVTVVESELTALRLIRHALEERIPLPVNYCSFPYKRRFQHAANRRRGAMAAANAYEEITGSGFIRSAALHGSHSILTGINAMLEEKHRDCSLWKMDPEGERIIFSSMLWDLLKDSGDIFSVSYHEAAITSMSSAGGLKGELILPSGRRLYPARQQVAEFTGLGGEAIEAILACEETELKEPMRRYEFIPTGLAEYF
jgi:pyruvate formate-lyase activating enzyme-like uncharacterized protein